MPVLALWAVEWEDGFGALFWRESFDERRGGGGHLLVGSGGGEGEVCVWMYMRVGAGVSAAGCTCDDGEEGEEMGSEVWHGGWYRGYEVEREGDGGVAP